MLVGGAEKREEMSVQTTVRFHKFSFELSIDPLLIPSLTCVSLPSHTCRSCHYCIQNNFDSVANYSCKPNTLKKSLINCSQKQRRSFIVLVFSGAIQLFIQTEAVQLCGWLSHYNHYNDTPKRNGKNNRYIHIFSLTNGVLARICSAVVGFLMLAYQEATDFPQPNCDSILNPQSWHHCALL